MPEQTTAKMAKQPSEFEDSAWKAVAFVKRNNHMGVDDGRFTTPQEEATEPQSPEESHPVSDEALPFPVAGGVHRATGQRASRRRSVRD